MIYGTIDAKFVARLYDAAVMVRSACRDFVRTMELNILDVLIHP